MEPEYFIRHQELCKDEINVKKGWKNYLKKLNKLKNKTFNLSHLSSIVLLACVQTSPISFVARGKGTTSLFRVPRATKEIGDVCAQAIVLLAYSSL